MLRKLFFIFATSLFATALPAAAEHIIDSDSCFAHIDSNLYVVGDHMPRYVEEIYVGEISPNGYDVELRYPEFQTVSGKELRRIHELQKSGVVPSDKTLDATGVVLMPSPAPTGGLNLEQILLVDRKKGYLDVSFCPLVRHEGTWKRILSCQVKVTPKQSVSAGSSKKSPSADERWSHNSVLSNGKWAKISVAKEGIYQLTASDIQKMGFSDLSKVKIYGYGGLLQDQEFAFPDVDESVLQTNAPDDLVEVPVYATGDNRILFWAEGTIRMNWNAKTNVYSHEQNYYSNVSCYFITENDELRSNVAVLQEEVAEGSAVQVSNVPYCVVLDDDYFSWYEGGRRMFDSYDFATGSTHSYRLATPGFNINAAGGKSIEVTMGASSNISTTPVNVKVNNKNLGNFIIDAYKSDYGTASVKTYSAGNLSSLSATEGNVFQLTTSNNNKARLDYIRINYPRHLELSETPYSFSPQVKGAVCLKIAGSNDKTHLWRIGQNGSPTAEVSAKLNGQGELEALVSSGSRRFVFFDESLTYNVPQFEGTIENQNLHADANVSYVIIVPANGKLVEQAERLGKLHEQRDGLSYKVVRADQLYNEFSSGTPDANAYRRYLKMLYDRAGDDDSAMPRYCLFMGKAYWDNRFVTAEGKGRKSEDYLLAFEADESGTVGSVYSYCTDDFFGFLDDGEGGNLVIERLDLGLGRMICANEEEAKLLVDKVERYMANDNAGSWKNTVAMLADDGDSNGHMKGSENVANIISATAPNLDVQKEYWDRYVWTSSVTGYTYPQATARIRQIMKEGALLFNYSGHGSPTTISHYKVLQLPDFSQSFSPYMSVWVLASCEIYPFDSGENNIAETSLYLPEGGSIAFICATRAVISDRNNFLNILFMKNVLSRDENGQNRTLGEALRRSKISLFDQGNGTGTDLTINKLKYICFGDPALRLAMPTGSVVLDSINGRAISSIEGLEMLSAGGAATFSGHVCLDNSTEIDESFNGNVSATIFDCEEAVTCKNNKDKGTNQDVGPMIYNERSKSIFKGTTKAEGGKFVFTAIIPRDISYTNKPGRISFYAVNADKTKEYNGFSEKFCLNGTSEMTEPDTKGPEVIAYINSIDNPDYTVTDENPVLIADISDDYGINNAGISLGHDIELVLDGNASDCVNLNSFFNYDFGSYQKGQIVYEMTGMSRGQHTAQLRVWDVNNNVTITDVHFIVRDKNAEGGKDGYVTATKNPATTDTRFITYFPSDAQVDGLVVYEVYDTRGRCVYKQPISVSAGSTTASHTWDLCGNDHQPLPAGVYFYRTVINSSNGAQATDAQKLIITRQ